MSTSGTIVIVVGLLALAGIVAYAVTRAPAATFQAPAAAPAPAPEAPRQRRSGLGDALETLNQLASVGAGLYSQSNANPKTTGLAGAIGGQK